MHTCTPTDTHTHQEDADDAGGGLSEDGALFSGSCIPAISVIISEKKNGETTPNFCLSQNERTRLLKGNVHISEF